jgi:hypothetical protein
MSNTFLAEVIATRLSHDLIGNIGAVCNGVELLKEGDEQDIEDVKNDIEIVVTEEIEVKEGTDDVEVETNDIVKTIEVVEVAETVVETPKINIKKRKGSYKNNNN